MPGTSATMPAWPVLPPVSMRKIMPGLIEVGSASASAALTIVAPAASGAFSQCRQTLAVAGTGLGFLFLLEASSKHQ